MKRVPPNFTDHTYNGIRVHFLWHYDEDSRYLEIKDVMAWDYYGREFKDRGAIDEVINDAFETGKVV